MTAVACAVAAKRPAAMPMTICAAVSSAKELLVAAMILPATKQHERAEDHALAVGRAGQRRKDRRADRIGERIGGDQMAGLGNRDMRGGGDQRQQAGEHEAIVLVANAPTASQRRRLSMTDPGSILCSKVIEQLDKYGDCQYDDLGAPASLVSGDARAHCKRRAFWIVSGTMSLPHPSIDQISLANVLAVLGDQTRLADRRLSRPQRGRAR